MKNLVEKWYASSLALGEGEHEIVAMVEKDNNIAYSEVLNIKVSASEGIEVEDVEQYLQEVKK